LHKSIITKIHPAPVAWFVGYKPPKQDVKKSKLPQLFNLDQLCPTEIAY